MFITNKQKEWMVDAILNLRQQVAELTEKLALSSKTYTKEEAPWGLKVNGTPRKKPGRTPKNKGVKP